MDVVSAANLQVQSMVLGTAREAIDAQLVNPVPADASPQQHAEVILELSSDAQNLLSS